MDGSLLDSGSETGINVPHMRGHHTLVTSQAIVGNMCTNTETCKRERYQDGLCKPCYDLAWYKKQCYVA